MQSIGLCLCDRPFISVSTNDTTYLCSAVMIGTTPRELYVICQNQTLVIKTDEIQEIRLIEYINPIKEIIGVDIESLDSNGSPLQRIAPSDIEIKEEEESIKKWKRGKIG